MTNPKQIGRRHIRLISLYWTRYAVRSGAGLVYLIIALIFGLSVAQMILTPVEKIISDQKKQGIQVDVEETLDKIIQFSRPVVEWALGSKSEAKTEAATHPDTQPPTTSQSQWAAYLLDERPALLSIIWLILILGMPFIISFLAFNQFSGDIQSRGLRYLLLRTERSHIYIGRFLGTVIFSTVVIALIVATITLYVGAKIRIYPLGMLWLWGLYGTLALSILMVPYIALCSWLSAQVDSPMLSLVAAKFAIGGVLLVSILGRLAWEPAEYFIYALPWGLQNRLFHPEPLQVLLTVGACIGYTALFFLLGYRRFTTRDL